MNDDRIEEYLDRWEDLQQQGQEVSAEELCPEEPELWDELSRRIEALKRTSWLIQSSKEPKDEPLGRTPADFDLPDVLGRYRLEELIGSGGFGQVWRAFDPDLHRSVAIKIPRPDRLVTSAQTERFLAEARRIAQLRHPGIVAVYDVGQDQDRCFIVTDLVSTGNLAEQIATDRLGPQQAVCIVEQVCEALEAAHRQNIIHRDVKPSNILIDADGRVLLADFGIALKVQEYQTTSSVPCGTLAYMSPEQLQGESIDGRSDIYSLGVVMYQLLTGQLPFTKTDPVELRKQIAGGVTENIVGRTDEVPPQFRSICTKALSANPDNRFSSANEMASALRLASEERSNRSGKFLRLLVVGLLIAVGFITWSFDRWEKSNQHGVRSIAGVPLTMKEPEDETVQPSTESIKVPVLENIHHYTGHTGSVYAVAVSSDGLQIASGGEDQSVLLQHFDDDNRAPKVLNQFGSVTALAFSPNGKVLSCGCDNGLVRRWRISDQEPQEFVVFPGHGLVRTMATSSDGHFLAAGDERGFTRLWKLGKPADRLATFPQADSPILASAFTEHGNRIVLGIGSDEDQPAQVWLWSIGADGNIHPINTRPLSGTANVSAMALSASGLAIASGNRAGEIQVWMPEEDVDASGKWTARFIGQTKFHQGVITSLLIAKSQRWGFSTSEDGVSMIWSIPDLQEVARLPADAPQVTAVTSSSDSTNLITGHSDGSVLTWKVPQ